MVYDDFIRAIYLEGNAISISNYRCMRRLINQVHEEYDKLKLMTK